MYIKLEVYNPVVFEGELDPEMLEVLRAIYTLYGRIPAIKYLRRAMDMYNDDCPDLTTAELFADSNRGVYIPQFFAQTVKRELVENVEPYDWEVLEYGPDHEQYWDVWDRVTNNAVINHPELGKCYLFQDGDLWIVPI